VLEDEDGTFLKSLSFNSSFQMPVDVGNETWVISRNGGPAGLSVNCRSVALLERLKDLSF
jgi:hypothetical protein